MVGQSSIQGGEVDTAYGNTDAWIVHADSVGHFVNAKVLGSSKQDEGNMIYPVSDGTILVGGYYTDSDGVFSSIESYCSIPYVEAFIAILGPQNQTGTAIIGQEPSTFIFPNPAHTAVSITAPAPGRPRSASKWA